MNIDTTAQNSQNGNSHKKQMKTFFWSLLVSIQISGRIFVSVFYIALHGDGLNQLKMTHQKIMLQNESIFLL